MAEIILKATSNHTHSPGIKGFQLLEYMFQSCSIQSLLMDINDHCIVFAKALSPVCCKHCLSNKSMKNVSEPTYYIVNILLLISLRKKSEKMIMRDASDNNGTRWLIKQTLFHVICHNSFGEIKHLYSILIKSIVPIYSPCPHCCTRQAPKSNVGKMKQLSLNHLQVNRRSYGEYKHVCLSKMSLITPVISRTSLSRGMTKVMFYFPCVHSFGNRSNRFHFVILIPQRLVNLKIARQLVFERVYFFSNLITRSQSLEKNCRLRDLWMLCWLACAVFSSVEIIWTLNRLDIETCLHDDASDWSVVVECHLFKHACIRMKRTAPGLVHVSKNSLFPLLSLSVRGEAWFHTSLRHWGCLVHPHPVMTCIRMTKELISSDISWT